MTFKNYLKDQFFFISIYFIFAIITIYFLFVFQVNSFLLIYFHFLLIVTGFILLFGPYLRKKHFYKHLIATVDHLDQKYLALELLEKPDFLEGKILYQMLSEIDKSMIEHINKYKFKQEDFKEYIEMWIHEVKTPISSSKLVIENNANKVTNSINEEIDKIDSLLEQILYYARSDSVEKDYIIKEITIDKIVKPVIAKNKKDFIHKKISLELASLKDIVITDSKWLEFILNQIIQNSIKYAKGYEDKIIISSEKNHDNVILRIEDHGIGINKNDLPKVFEKGFTGQNGRKQYNSTGMGLYLCKKLITKLGHEIMVNSIDGKKTIVTIIFPKNSYTMK